MREFTSRCVLPPLPLAELGYCGGSVMTQIFITIVPTKSVEEHIYCRATLGHRQARSKAASNPTLFPVLQPFCKHLTCNVFLAFRHFCTYMHSVAIGTKTHNNGTRPSSPPLKINTAIFIGQRTPSYTYVLPESRMSEAISVLLATEATQSDRDPQ